MIRKKFIDREEELNFLEKRWKKHGFEFIVVSGRRRTGKSRLLKKFVSNKKNIFLLCEDRKWEYNLSLLNKKISDYFKIPDPNFKSFSDCFKFIASKKKKMVITIDEFSYLIKKSDVVAEFQTIVDEILHKTPVMLIISGSAVSMMNKKILGYKSPLYGRTTGAIFLQPLKFKDLYKWFNNSKPEYLVKIYGVTDGIPKYLEFFEGKNAENEIINNIFNPNSFLFREPKLLLEEELREPETYFQILEAISMGYTKVVEIANYSYMDAKNISSYLSILMDLGFVKREFSITDKKRARGIYEIKDNFFNFWFRFVSRHFGEIEIGEPEAALKNFKRDFNSYLGIIFEKVSKEFLINKMPFKFQKIGKWWRKNKEIDLVAIGDKDVGFFECKWKNLTKKQALKILENLKEKSYYVDIKRKKRHFGIIAKKIKDKTELKKQGYMAFDLNDF